MELIEAIFGEVVIKGKGPPMDVLCELRIVEMHEEKNAIIIEVSTCKAKEVLQVVRGMLIPLGNNIL